MRHEGSLEKLSSGEKIWERRWFVLKDGVLSYYADEEEARRQETREHGGTGVNTSNNKTVS